MRQSQGMKEMLVNKLIIPFCLMLLVPMQGQAAEVYKWKDVDGKIRYSDTPPAGKTPYEILSGKKAAAARAGASDEGISAPVANGKTVKPAADKEIDARKRKAEADNTQKKSQEKLEEQKVREQNCVTAKSNMQIYKQGGRMYKIDEKGERQYMDDKDIAAGLEKANQEVEQWCGGQ